MRILVDIPDEYAAVNSDIKDDISDFLTDYCYGTVCDVKVLDEMTVGSVFLHWECDEHGDGFRVWIDSNKYDIPEGATFGDMMKNIFPQFEVFVMGDNQQVTMLCGEMRMDFNKDVWNSSYRKEQK